MQERRPIRCANPDCEITFRPTRHNNTFHDVNCRHRADMKRKRQKPSKKVCALPGCKNSFNGNSLKLYCRPEHSQRMGRIRHKERTHQSRLARLIEIECTSPICDVRFMVDPSRHQKYHTPKCRAAANYLRDKDKSIRTYPLPKIICAHPKCDIEFIPLKINQKYHSKLCGRLGRDLLKRVDIPERECANSSCSISFKPKSKIHKYHCSACLRNVSSLQARIDRARGRKKRATKKQCANPDCHVVFRTDKGMQKYHSSKCRQDAGVRRELLKRLAERPSKICAYRHCDNEFKSQGHQEGKVCRIDYCSNEHQQLERSLRTKENRKTLYGTENVSAVECHNPECDVMFIPRSGIHKYHSHDCGDRHYRSKLVDRTERICANPDCDETFVPVHHKRLKYHSSSCLEHTKKLRVRRAGWLILDRDDFRCYVCARFPEDLVEGETMTIEHMVPEKLGGLSTASNLITCCSKHNFGKSIRLMNPASEKRVFEIVAKRNREANLSPNQMIKLR